MLIHCPTSLVRSLINFVPVSWQIFTHIRSFALDDTFIDVVLGLCRELSLLMSEVMQPKSKPKAAEKHNHLPAKRSKRTLLMIWAASNNSIFLHSTVIISQFTAP